MSRGAIAKGICVDCGEVFAAPVKRGRVRRRCNKHSRHANRMDESEMKMMIPRTGIQIIRTCLCCHNGFIARTDAALYCGLECFVRDRKHLPPTVGQLDNLRLGPRASRRGESAGWARA